MITSNYQPRILLEVLVREISVKNRTVPEWNKAIDDLEQFADLTPEEILWLAGVRYVGCYTRPHV